MGYSWLDLSSKNEEVIQPKNLSAAKEMTEVSLVKKPEESQTAEKKLPASTDKPDDPLNKVSIYESAGDMFREGRTTEAEARYRKILEIDPGHVETLNNLGVIYMNKGDYNSALSTFEKTVKLKPDYVEAYYNMACLFSIKGEPEKGIVYLKKAVGLDENVREWALSDSDLRDMRELPEFQTEVLKR
jgi:tetratricopeptide (TPR) repeat protein